MEDPGHDKVEHEKLVGNTNNEELNAAATSTQNINIVIYSLPHSLLSPNIFPVYVIQVSQSYVTLWNIHSKSEIQYRWWLKQAYFSVNLSVPKKTFQKTLFLTLIKSIYQKLMRSLCF